MGQAKEADEEANGTVHTKADEETIEHHLRRRTIYKIWNRSRQTRSIKGRPFSTGPIRMMEDPMKNMENRRSMSMIYCGVQKP